MAELSISPDVIRDALKNFAAAYEPTGAVATEVGTVIDAADGNNVVVGDFAAKRLVSIPAVGSANAFDIPHVIAHTEGGIGPDGFALDAAGNLYAAIFQGREVRVFGADRFPYGSIVLPADAGTFVTNVAFHGGWLYITEASQGVVWRVAVRNPGLALFHQR